jgi:hypothetical protein
LPELLETARTRPLTLEETHVLSDALRKQEPWLEWAGKQEKKGIEVDPAALQIGDQDRAKHQAAKRWVSAVNNWGQLGRWDFQVCKDPQLLGREIDWLKQQAADG